ncbi:kinesin, partial [Naegleria gruberi]
LTKSVLDGYNVSIFAYGQTGTGKTHTMQGNGDEIGIQQYILQDLYNHKNKDKDMYNMTIALSCMEIYNETCIDLLRSQDNKLELKMDPQNKKIIAQGLREVVCNELQEALQCLIFAQKNRAVSSTSQNHRSSRSHLIVQISVCKMFLKHPEANSEEEQQNITPTCTTSQMYLIDLAGSEKINTSGASNPITDSETKHINKSLSALGNVMEGLRNRSAKPGQNAHIPYRDTKLTYFMSNVFRDKHSICCMIPHVAPSSLCFNESLRTLQFAERMSGIALNNVNQ